MITSSHLRELEEKALDHGITVEELMENAGKKVFLSVKKRFDLEGKHILVFCGTGNNGGDGFVAARYFARVCPVVILLFGDKKKFSVATQKNYDAIKKKVNVLQVTERKELNNFHIQQNHGLILIDALLGIGGKGSLHDPISFAMRADCSYACMCRIAVKAPAKPRPSSLSYARPMLMMSDPRLAKPRPSVR